LSYGYPSVPRIVVYHGAFRETYKVVNGIPSKPETTRTIIKSFFIDTEEKKLINVIISTAIIFKVSGH